VVGWEQNPFYGNLQNASNQAGIYSQGQGQANIGQADMLRGGAGAVMNTAFDPQGALRAREEQRLQDQVRVGQAARGITSSPYGADLESDAMANFALDWQDRQLGRQTSGLGAAGAASQQGGAMGQMGVNQTQQAGQLPYSAYQQQQDQTIQNWIAYMNQKNLESGLNIQNYPNVASVYTKNNTPQTQTNNPYGWY
jgi:hypothetical protein